MEVSPTSQPRELTQPVESDYVLHRRFDRMGRLVGDDLMKRFFKTHVMVIGLGGVGSWAAESLARTGIGHLTIVDFDDICITNANRQLHALQGLVGRKKADVMAERLRKINPQAKIDALPMFYNAENSDKILGLNPEYVVDAIDNITAKCHLIATCKNRGLKLVTSAGSAAKVDPTRIKLADLADTTVDPLAAQVRKILRQKYAFPREGGPFGVPCVYSEEAPRDPIALKYDKGEGFKCVCPQNENNLHTCDNRNVIHGTASFVTGAFGLTAASWIARDLMGETN